MGLIRIVYGTENSWVKVAISGASRTTASKPFSGAKKIYDEGWFCKDLDPIPTVVGKEARSSFLLVIQRGLMVGGVV